MWSLVRFVTATIVQEYYRAIRARVRKGEENAFQAFATLLRKNQQRYGGYVVHLGVVLICHRESRARGLQRGDGSRTSKPGDSIEIDDYRLWST